ncbi:hypothetical protein [Treponema endosymbiont of Eucomonympha sp.]|uniref:hypothetical protein n=1 Tax=Treponema endosymbiont of Eucomonympha sp. TaxID=1580831 RepID=UPI001396B998|nr:hypothetical protein [Treponema endosymbiont of Eucomonympha sp.]
MQSSPLPSSPPFMSGVCSSTFKSTLPKTFPCFALKQGQSCTGWALRYLTCSKSKNAYSAAREHAPLKARRFLRRRCSCQMFVSLFSVPRCCGTAQLTVF